MNHNIWKCKTQAVNFRDWKYDCITVTSKKKRKAISRRSIKWEGESHVSRGSVTFLYHNVKKFVTRDKFTILSRNKKVQSRLPTIKKRFNTFLYQVHPACTTPDVMYTSPWSWGQQLSTEHRCENWGSGAQDGGIHSPSFRAWKVTEWGSSRGSGSPPMLSL